MRILLITLLLSFLAGCASTGTKSPSMVLSQLDQLRDTNSVFVLRDTGFSGSFNSLRVVVNGEEVGTLSNGESLVARARQGENSVEASFTGMSAMSIDPKYSSFSAEGEKNHFFLVSLTTNAFSNELRVLKVSEESFRDSL